MATNLAEKADVAGDVQTEWSIPKHQGARYFSVLKGLHDALRPRSYLEVGIRNGHSLALAHCVSIGIDPRFELTVDAKADKPDLFLYTTTSDKFFAEAEADEAKKPTTIMGVDSIDFFFLDGMHQSDFLLRDFINAEKYASTDSMICLHDCVPIDIAMTKTRAERAAFNYPVVYPNFWAGDVWKLLPILKKYRPELKLDCMDSHPTGLVFITGLDPKSTVLQDNQEQILEDMKELDLMKMGISEYAESLPLRPTAEFVGEENLLGLYRPWGCPG